ncbi:MAG: ABC transporter substrate-binding protein [Pseudomonadota bacterium]
MKKIISLLVFSLFAVATEQDSLKLQMENLFEASKKVNAPETEKEKSRKEIESAIDWEGIARLCLGEQNAKKYKGKNFGDFKDLLKEVISKTAFSRMDKFWAGGTKAQIDKVEIQGPQAHVGAKFISNNETFSLDYYLTKKGNTWAIHDVAYEDMKYSVNIKEQLDAFLREKPFSELLVKLRKKREELDKPAKTKSS